MVEREEELTPELMVRLVTYCSCSKSRALSTSSIHEQSFNLRLDSGILGSRHCSLLNIYITIMRTQQGEWLLAYLNLIALNKFKGKYLLKQPQ